MSGNAGTSLTQSPEQVLGLRWVTAPPIVQLQEKDISVRLSILGQNMDGWDAVTVPKSPMPEDPMKPGLGDIDQRDWKQPKRTQQERWNERMDATRRMLGFSFGTEYVVEYRMASGPVGIMALIDVDPTYIADIVTHPGSDQVGGILIEHAVNKSEEWGKAGKLELFALTDDAVKAYEALGFVVTSGSNMALDPTTQTKIWVRMTGRGWCLAKYQGEQHYITSAKPLPPVPTKKPPVPSKKLPPLPTKT